jgi:hypothetical protein
MFFKWPYQAMVMKTLLQQSRTMVSAMRFMDEAEA